jgi:hypothetical protein
MTPMVAEPLDVQQWMQGLILNLEAYLKSLPGVKLGNCFPLRHSFGDGIYVRECYVPAGYVFTGRIHKTMNPNFLMAGEALFATEQHGTKHMLAPAMVMAVPGEKRAVIAITDIWFVTVHANPTNCHDTERLETELFAWDYEEYGAWQKQGGHA